MITNKMDDMDAEDLFRSLSEVFDIKFDNKDFLESQPLVLSHNDCQKSNIVKDLNDNYFLI